MDSGIDYSPHRADDLVDLSHFESGYGFFFDLEPVLRRAKSGWLKDHDRLKTICERQARKVAPHDLLVFSGSGFFLVSVSGNEVDAQLRASQLNLSLLQLLFGTESLVPDQMVTMFRGATTEEVREATPNFKLPERAERVQEIAERVAAENIQFGFLSIEDFRNNRTTALFCSPFRRSPFGTEYGYQTISHSLDDKLSLDLAALEQSLVLTRRLIQAGLFTAVGTPVHYETLSRPRWREAYQQKLREANVMDNPLLLLKIDAIPEGVASSRLAYLVHCIRPFTKRIFVHLAPRTLPLSQTGLLGASGFVCSLSRGLSADQVAEETNYLVRFCLSQGALSSIDNIETRAQWDLVRSAGARFGTCAATERSTLDADTQLAALLKETVAAS